jgi:hypothetical protein
MKRNRFRRLSRLSRCLPVLLVLLWGGPAAAFQLDLGNVQGSLDTTLSYGLSWRVADQDRDLIGLQEGGRAYSHNFDDGNLNYDKWDLISNTTKLTSELALDYKDFGLFVRGTAFYDFATMDGDTRRTELRGEALDLVGRDMEFLDSYLYWNFQLGDLPGQIRVGDQVLSWGESTFIQNGINVINPFDVSKLRVPGAELKEGLVPVGLVSLSVSPTDNLSFEGFYQYDWEAVSIDPPGSYWSTNDFVGDGGNKVMLGFGDAPDLGNASPFDTLLGVPRAPDIYADDSGQYGIAMHLYAPGLNDTEFGFYFMNYHSRLPVISSWTGSQQGLIDAGTVGVVAPSIIGDGTLGVGILGGQSVSTLVTTYGGTIGAEAATAIAGATAQTLAATGDPVAAGAAGAAAATAYATDAYAKTARYQVEYPEDIKLYGMSFNTVLPDSGVALQGEVSFHKDMPLQIDDLELLLATLEPLSIAKVLGPGGNVPLDPTYSQFDTVSPLDIIMNGGAPIYIPGYQRLDVTQAQTTATKLFGPSFGADQFTMVGEVGVTYVHGMPSGNKLRFDGPGTPVTGNENHANPAYPLAAHAGKQEEPAKAFADDTSWGYRLVGKLDFNNAIGAVTLSPRIAWAHDVKGTSPGPGGNFVEGRKAITLGLGANYQNSWSADLSYTNFFGAGRYNLVNDRDFVALNIKYSF